ncbi:MAG: APC family permease [Candidatus Bathyarchaeia archaeon]
MSKDEELLFVRTTSGLVRVISPYTVIFLALAPSLSAYFLATSPQLIVSYPGVDLPLLFFLAGLILIIEGVGEFFLMVTMPRSGGDYVVLGRSLGPFFGVMEGWRATLQNPISLGFGNYTAAYTIPGFISLLGVVMKDSGMVALGSSLSTNQMFIVGMAILLAVIGALFDLLGPRIMSRWMSFWGIVTLIGLVLMWVLALQNPAATLRDRWDAVWAPGAYDEVVTVAQANGWRPAVFSWDSMFKALFIPVSMLWPYNAIPVAGEVSEPKKSFLIGAVGSAAVMCVVTTLTAWSYIYSYGDFASQYSYVILKGFGGQLTKSPRLSISYPTFAALLAPQSPVLVGYLGGLVVWSNFGRMPSSFFWTTRNAFAMAMDRFAPEWFTRISRWHSPKYGVLFCFLLGCAAIVLCSYSPWLAVVSLLAIYFFIRFEWTLCEIVLPYLRRHIWERGLPLTIGALPVLTLVGIVNAILFGFFMLNAIVGAKIETIYAFLLTYGTAIVLFLIYAHWNTKKGLPIDKTFYELPPE